MVFDVIGAAILMAFGILAVYFSLGESTSDRHLSVVLLIGIAAILAGGYVLLSRLTLAIILTKLAGLIMAAIGFFLVFGFPDVPDYQPEGMGITGIFIGVVLIISGLYFLFF